MSSPLIDAIMLGPNLQRRGQEMQERKQRLQMEQEAQDQALEQSKEDHDLAFAKLISSGAANFVSNGMARRPVQSGPSAFQADAPIPGVPGAGGIPSQIDMSYFEKADPTRLITHTTRDGQTLQAELASPAEQIIKQMQQFNEQKPLRQAADDEEYQNKTRGYVALPKSLEGWLPPGTKIPPTSVPAFAGLESPDASAPEGPKTTEARLGLASQRLGALSTPAAYKVMYDRTDKDLQPSFDPPEQFDPVKTPLHARIAGMKPEDQIKYGGLANQTSADWDAKVDAAYPPTGDTAAQNKVAKMLVGRYVKSGDPKELDKADAIIKDGLDQQGKTSTAVATAKATAPIKISVGAAEQRAKDVARTPGQQAVDMMAEDLLNGKSPSSRNPVMYAQVYQRAAELAKERGLTNQQVVMERNAAGANKQALNGLTKQYQNVEAFSQTAEKNMQMLEKAMAEVGNYGAPILNAPIRSLSSKFAGDPKVAAFQASLQPVQAEIGRILGSANANGVLTDSMRHEVEGALSLDATPAQIHAALDVFRKDMSNRRETYRAQIADLQGRTVVGNTAQPAAASPPPDTYKFHGVGPNGHRIGSNGGPWVDLQTGVPVQ